MSSPDDMARMREFDERMRQDTRSLRAYFIHHVPTFTVAAAAEELSKRTKTEVTQDSVRSLVSERRIFSVRHEDQERVPAFQFDELGQPLPVIHELLEIFARYKARSDWDNALWFVAENDWLDGAAPLGLLKSEPTLVKDAAEQAVLPHIE
jgi:hypothetical protein